LGGNGANPKLPHPGPWAALLIGIAIIFKHAFWHDEIKTVDRPKCIPTVVVSADSLCKPS